MVAEEVPAVLPKRVGVKRSREQPTDQTRHAVQVRPALEADPAAPPTPPTMTPQGRTARPSLVPAAPSTSTTVETVLTHGLLGLGCAEEEVGHPYLSPLDVRGRIKRLAL
jgi:hypothetical protein